MPREAIATTRERILGAALNQLSRSGFSGITLGGLAEQTGMSKSGLFAHFLSKEELQLELLEKSAALAGQVVVEPAFRQKEGLARLEMLIGSWLGWTGKAGLAGGCPLAAALFELDDAEGPVKKRVVAMEKEWRALLKRLVKEAITRAEFRKDLDADQFVWELCGIYLSHHVSLRLVLDPRAGTRARAAVRALIERAKPKRHRS